MLFPSWPHIFTTVVSPGSFSRSKFSTITTFLLGTKATGLNELLTGYYKSSNFVLDKFNISRARWIGTLMEAKAAQWNGSVLFMTLLRMFWWCTRFPRYFHPLKFAVFTIFFSILGLLIISCRLFCSQLVRKQFYSTPSKFKKKKRKNWINFQICLVFTVKSAKLG